MSIKQNFPVSDPTLNLDFANSQAVDTRITFTRPSAATVTNAQGVLQTMRDNKPRIDFDPNTGECRGLLIEEQRTNLIVYSNDPDYSSWTLSGASIAKNVAIAPDGTMSADKIVENTGSSTHGHYQALSVTNSTLYTWSAYFKAAERTSVMVYAQSSRTPTAIYNLSTGTVTITTDSDTTATATITPASNGWYRCTITATTVGTTAYFNIAMVVSGNQSYTGNGSSGLFVWGTQFEQGGFATSYIPTTPTFVSRASSATYFDSTGVLRTAPAGGARYGFGYDSATAKWISQGLVLEPTATNLIAASYGSSLSTVYALYSNWNSASISYNVAIGPDGAYSAYRATPQSPTATSNFRFAATAGTRYTFSVWLKKDPGSNNTNLNYFGFQVAWSNNGSSLTGYDSLALQSVDGGPLDDTWRRFSFSYVCPAGATSMELGVGNRGNGTGNPGYTVLCYGFQIEAGSAATSYIPTYGSTATRAADVSASAATTRAADDAIIKAPEFTKFNGSTECTLYGEATTISGPALTNGRPALVSISNNLDRDTHRFILRRNDQLDDAAQSGFNYRLATVINGTSYSIDHATVNGAQPEWEDYAVHKTIFSVSTATQQAYGDGVSAGITSISIPNFDKFNQLEIGNGGSSRYWNGHIRKITYYNKKLTDKQAQTLTV